MSAALRLALVLSIAGHTQDIDMDSLVEIPVAARKQSMTELLVSLEMGASWLARAACRYDAGRFSGGDLPTVYRDSLERAITQMEQAIQDYRNG